MVQVNAIGDACPIPVIKTLHALQDLNGAGTVQTLVDNEIAVQNLTRLAESKGCSITTEKRSDKEFCVTITTENSIGKAETDEQIEVWVKCLPYAIKLFVRQYIDRVRVLEPVKVAEQVEQALREEFEAYFSDRAGEKS